MKKLTQKSKLLIGYAISGLGDQFYTFAIPLLMLSRTHSSIIMGLLTAVEYLPTALFGLTIGPIFDMYSRKKIMLFSLIMQMVLIIIAPFLVIRNVSIYWLLLVIFLLGSFDLITWTGYQIFIAESVKKEELSSVSGQVGLISSVQKTFGPGIAAVIINLINYIGGFLLDALSFGYLTYVIKDYEPLQTENGAMKKESSFNKSAKKGISFLFAHHDIKWLLASFFVANVGFQAVVPMLTFLLKQEMKVSVNLVSVFYTVAAVASIIGNFIYLRINKNMKLGTQMIMIGLLIMCGFMIMLNVQSFFWVTFGYAIVSFGCVWSQANFFTIIQAETPPQFKGTITSISTSLTRIIGPIMSLISGFLIKAEVHSIFVVASVCMFLSVFISLVTGLSKLGKLEKLH
ncbi:MFS transporter [Lactobacillus melliventris]|uniref:Permease n=1 Tax=Lactobacillus melliventris TaxID=1218507 RepID=A0A0F4LEC6_9LACO|nr:MFS transporter [Lactobacillus melliventris]KJY57192.1 Permease [Lactobacillus melliventris]